MKPKKMLLLLCILIVHLATVKNIFAQAPATASANQILLKASGENDLKNLTSRVFMAPNKTYGYDILMNGKVIYHQPAFSRVPGDHDLVIKNKEQATAASEIIIQKIMKGEKPVLSADELRKILTH